MIVEDVPISPLLINRGPDVHRCLSFQGSCPKEWFHQGNDQGLWRYVMGSIRVVLRVLCRLKVGGLGVI